MQIDFPLTVYIYTLSDPESGHIRYVGKTISLQTRLHQHLREKYNYKKNTWLKSLKEKNLQPTIEVLEELSNSSEIDWQESEKFWITYLRFLGCDLVNLTEGGMGATPGYKRSSESVSKMAATNRGRKHSPETIEKMRLAAKGRIIPESTREKSRLVHTGKHLSPEHKLKMSIAHKGKKHSPEAIRKSAEARRGQKFSEETRINMSIGRIEAWKRQKTERALFRHIENMQIAA